MIKTIRAAIAALTAGLVLMTMAGCGGSGGGGGSKCEVAPGTVGELPDEIKNASELGKTLDPTNEKVILFYYRNDYLKLLHQFHYRLILNSDGVTNLFRD